MFKVQGYYYVLCGCRGLTKFQVGLLQKSSVEWLFSLQLIKFSTDTSGVSHLMNIGQVFTPASALLCIFTNS